MLEVRCQGLSGQSLYKLHTVCVISGDRRWRAIFTTADLARKVLIWFQIKRTETKQVAWKWNIPRLKHGNFHVYTINSAAILDYIEYLKIFRVPQILFNLFRYDHHTKPHMRCQRDFEVF